jgi:hypothetical protein
VRENFLKKKFVFHVVKKKYYDCVSLKKIYTNSIWEWAIIMILRKKNINFDTLGKKNLVQLALIFLFQFNMNLLAPPHRNKWPAPKVNFTHCSICLAHPAVFVYMATGTQMNTHSITLINRLPATDLDCMTLWSYKLANFFVTRSCTTILSAHYSCHL